MINGALTFYFMLPLLIVASSAKSAEVSLMILCALSWLHWIVLVGMGALK